MAVTGRHRLQQLQPRLQPGKAQALKATARLLELAPNFELPPNVSPRIAAGFAAMRQELAEVDALAWLDRMGSQPGREAGTT